jgi:hypothetical protein
MPGFTSRSYHKATSHEGSIAHVVLLRSFRNDHSVSAPAILNNFGTHPSQYILSSTARFSYRGSREERSYLRIVLRDANLDSEGPKSKIFEEPIHWHSGTVERYRCKDIVEIAVSVWLYTVQQTVQDFQKGKTGGCLSYEMARQDTGRINCFGPSFECVANWCCDD